MLLPFEFVIFTKEDAIVLLKFIESQFTSKNGLINYVKIQNSDISSTYNRLENFINKSSHYEHELSVLDPDCFVREGN